jgi:hypothetical protein
MNQSNLIRLLKRDFCKTSLSTVVLGEIKVTTCELSKLNFQYLGKNEAGMGFSSKVWYWDRAFTM